MCNCIVIRWEMGDNFQRGSVIFLFRNKTLPFPLPGAQAGFLRAVNTPHKVQWGAASRGQTLTCCMKSSAQEPRRVRGRESCALGGWWLGFELCSPPWEGALQNLVARAEQFLWDTARNEIRSCGETEDCRAQAPSIPGTSPSHPQLWWSCSLGRHHTMQGCWENPPWVLTLFQIGNCLII